MKCLSTEAGSPNSYTTETLRSTLKMYFLKCINLLHTVSFYNVKLYLSKVYTKCIFSAFYVNLRLILPCT